MSGRADLEAAAQAFQERAVEQSEITELPPFGIAVLAFKDPDGSPEVDGQIRHVGLFRGRLDAPVARREDRQRFWEAIARGLTGEDAAVSCGVSRVVGTR